MLSTIAKAGDSIGGLNKMAKELENDLPSSYALAATLAAMRADIFLILENGG